MNFIPSPNFPDIIKKEWLETAKATRRIKIHNAYNSQSDTGNNNTTTNTEILSKPLPAKLKISKSSAPDEVSEETSVLVEFVENSTRNLQSMFHKIRPNLNKKQLQAFKKLKKQKQIVISKSDKDGKIIILDVEDFREIVQDNLTSFTKIANDQKELNNELKKAKEKIDESVQNLYTNETINDVELLHTIGQYFDNSKFSKTRQYAHEFSYKDKYANVYPLFKTHKDPKTKIYPGKQILHPRNIPVRLVTSCTNSITTRASALLQHLYGDKIDEVCGDEFCRDTPHYLATLQSEQYKRKLDLIQNNFDPERELHIVALDVVGIYPNSPRSLVLDSLEKNLISFYQPTQIKEIIKLTEICLTNTIVANNNQGYVVKDGILTGASNSTSLANSFLTTITRPVRTDEAMLLFKRFIDDIISHIFQPEKN